MNDLIKAIEKLRDDNCYFKKRHNIKPCNSVNIRTKCISCESYNKTITEVKSWQEKNLPTKREIIMLKDEIVVHRSGYIRNKIKPIFKKLKALTKSEWRATPEALRKKKYKRSSNEINKTDSN